MTEAFQHPICEQLRQTALALPETSEGSSCVNRAFKARKKNFVFVGEPKGQIRIMLKLGPSLEHAAALEDPRIGVGKTGWVTIVFGPEEPVALAQLQAWIVESYRMLAPKTLVKALEGANAH